MKFAVTLALALAMIAPVNALQPIALTATPSETGILLEWIDSGVATQYVIDRDGPDGQTQFIVPGSASSFIDSDIKRGTYSYQVTAMRGTEADQSNAAPMIWPYCLPAPVMTMPPSVYWPRDCYCPFPNEIDELEFLLCD